MDDADGNAAAPAFEITNIARFPEAPNGARRHRSVCCPAGEGKMEALRAVFPMLIVVALAAVAVVLLVGVAGMLRGGAFNRRYGNGLMRLRVILQGVAVALIVVYALFVREP